MLLHYTDSYIKTTSVISGLVFPIIGFHCKLTAPGLTLVDTAATTATVSWNSIDPTDEYALRITYTKHWTSTEFYTSDTVFQFTGLNPGGTYQVQVSRGCRYTTTSYDTVVYSNGSDSIQFTLPKQTEGIDEAEGLPFDLQPNPASGSVVLTLDAVEGGTVTVTDLAGREVLQQPLQPGAKRHKIDIGQLPAGAYLVRVATPTATGTRRLLVR